jgi:glycosyltransferase involved in cell wall biosynthesis
MIRSGLRHGTYRTVRNVVDTVRFKFPDAPTVRHQKKIVHISCFEDRSKNISGILKTVAGEGMDLESMQVLAGELGIRNSYARFTGLLEGDDLVKALAESNFLVLFSNYENMPVVIPEAFACGIPVLATRVGGIPEIVNDTNGMLVEPADEEALLEALNEMLDNFQKFDRTAMRAFAVKEFSNQAVGKVFDDLYREL